jgi:hypothetical protein
LDGSHEAIIVGGGEDGRIIVGYIWTTADHHNHSYFLNEPERGESLEIRTIGGQESDLPARMWVLRSTALPANRHFVVNGGRRPEDPWVLDLVD